MPLLEKKPRYLLKYEYESKLGYGLSLISADNPEEAIRAFRFKMFAKRDPLWMSETYHHTEFDFVSRTKTGWSIYQNSSGSTMLKLIDINELPDVAWLSEKFESF